MSYIPKTCPDCGANLDPGERCDCKDIENPLLGENLKRWPKEGYPVTKIEERDGGITFTVDTNPK